MARSKDRFEDLPDDVLELLLSFLPTRDAVRTSMLAPRWRTLWKSVPALRLDGSQFESAQVFSNFVNKLLEHRDRTSHLHECEIFFISKYYYGRFDREDKNGKARREVESWVQYAVLCRVPVLRVLNWGDNYMELSSSSVISKHLTRLELYQLVFYEGPLDLFSCEALEVLEMEDCTINLGDILPKSLRHLKARESRFFSWDWKWDTRRNCISAPGLLTFELADCVGWTPLLESLPSLVTSFIRINMNCEDVCMYNEYRGDCGDGSCEGCYGEDGRCLLLEGLASATNLELISEYSVHTPILEKLALQLPSHEYLDIISSGSYNPAEYFLVSKHLKVVEIYCRKESEWINQIVNILGIHGVTSAQISIKHDFWCSFRFSFEQPK
ncbi:F-box/FBD/LRR-repeat protein At5g22660-like isoform X4 [Triticum urartu]|uniref:F-box/FBD/LRR-repeat protein At5g22660-like isoform X4 n=1 Tax=Triticum urartu TaxID=4572 RepID=UPI0020448810|nr:F-box/FBD/LRR-repeat protein At5g22660-like isoform X4 [Triticum urartu]